MSEVPAAARARKVAHEHLGEIVYIDVSVGDDADGFRVYAWKCPACGAAFKALSLRQLAANVENHKRKHVDIDWGD